MAEVGIGGGANTFVPTFSPATGQIQVEFTRSPNRFGITQYARIVPTSQMRGYFLRIDEEETARIVNTQSLQWPIGQDAPTGITNDFEFSSFYTQRFAAHFAIPKETIDQSMWDIVASHARIQAHKMMLLRTIRTLTVATTAGNWPTGSTAASATAAGGGSWTGSTVANGYIQKTITAIRNAIIKNAVGAITPSDLIMVMDPPLAKVVSEAPETKEYIKYHAAAMNFYRGDTQFGTYGIPSHLFGIRALVEDAVQVTSVKGATKASQFLLGNGSTGKVLFLSRPDGLVGAEGVPSFSTLNIFAYEDMTVETWDDPVNKRTRGRVIDNSDIQLVAPLSGYYLQDALS